MTIDTIGVVGNIATDPEVRFSKAGRPWTSFRLAVKPYVAGATEQPEPEFYEVVVFGPMAENVSDTLTKGSRVCVAGKLENESWTGRDGVERITQKIIAEGIGPDLRFTGSKRTASQPTAPDTTVSGLVGASRGYAEEPF